MSVFPKPGAEILNGRRAEIAFNCGEDQLVLGSILRVVESRAFNPF